MCRGDPRLPGAVWRRGWVDIAGRVEGLWPRRGQSPAAVGNEALVEFRYLMLVVRYAWWSDQEHENIQLEKWGTFRLVHGGRQEGEGF